MLGEAVQIAVSDSVSGHRYADYDDLDARTWHNKRVVHPLRLGRDSHRDDDFEEYARYVAYCHDRYAATTFDKFAESDADIGFCTGWLNCKVRCGVTQIEMEFWDEVEVAADAYEYVTELIDPSRSGVRRTLVPRGEQPDASKLMYSNERLVSLRKL